MDADFMMRPAAGEYFCLKRFRRTQRSLDARRGSRAPLQLCLSAVYTILN